MRNTHLVSYDICEEYVSLDDLSAARISRDLLGLWLPRSESVPTFGLVQQQRLFQALVGRHLAEQGDR